MPKDRMNIDKVAGKQKPPAYRLKIGRIRVEYFVDGQMIVIFNIFMNRDFEGVISEGEETECADKIWEYYETHKDELEDLDEYAKKRGLVKHVI